MAELGTLGRHSLRLEKMDTEKLCIFGLNLKLLSLQAVHVEVG